MSVGPMLESMCPFIRDYCQEECVMRHKSDKGRRFCALDPVESAQVIDAVRAESIPKYLQQFDELIRFFFGSTSADLDT